MYNLCENYERIVNVSTLTLRVLKHRKNAGKQKGNKAGKRGRRGSKRKTRGQRETESNRGIREIQEATVEYERNKKKSRNTKE